MCVEHGKNVVCIMYLCRILMRTRSGMMYCERKVFCHLVKMWRRLQRKTWLTLSRILLQRSREVSWT